jgi:hypothetical protein
MNKLLTALILTATAATAQANTVNLSCNLTIANGKQKTIQLELHVDPRTMYGIVDGRRASMGNHGDFYTVDTENQAYHFMINRSTLAISEGLTFMEGFGFMPDDFVGNCQKIQTNNQI